MTGTPISNRLQGINLATAIRDANAALVACRCEGVRKWDVCETCLDNEALVAEMSIRIIDITGVKYSTFRVRNAI